MRSNAMVVSLLAGLVLSQAGAFAADQNKEICEQMKSYHEQKMREAAETVKEDAKFFALTIDTLDKQLTEKDREYFRGFLSKRNQLNDEIALNPEKLGIKGTPLFDMSLQLEEEALKKIRELALPAIQAAAVKAYGPKYGAQDVHARYASGYSAYIWHPYMGVEGTINIFQVYPEVHENGKVGVTLCQGNNGNSRPSICTSIDFIGGEQQGASIDTAIKLGSKKQPGEQFIDHYSITKSEELIKKYCGEEYKPSVQALDVSLKQNGATTNVREFDDPCIIRHGTIAK